MIDTNLRWENIKQLYLRKHTMKLTSLHIEDVNVRDVQNRRAKSIVLFLRVTETQIKIVTDWRLTVAALVTDDKDPASMDKSSILFKR